MRFRATHKLASYLLVATALVTLAISNPPTLLPLLGAAMAAALSWRADPGSRIGNFCERSRTALTVLAVAVFGFTILEVVRSFPEPDLTPILNLVLFLLVYKLFQRRSNRDYLQVYVLSFVVVLAASWLAQSVFFAVGFSFYVVVATWTLILFHLRREIEDNYLVKHSGEATAEKVTVARVLDSRRVVGPAFFAVTGLAAIGVLLGSVLVFVLAPRIGLGFLTGGLRRRANVVGFNDDVQLGQHGTLATDNDTVVLRARVPRLEALGSDDERDRVVSRLYWRGTVYDTYQDGHWLRSRAPETATHLDDVYVPGSGRVSVVSGPGDAERIRRDRRRLASLLGAAERQEIQVVALSHPVAFALDRPIAYALAQPATGALVSTEIEGRFSGEASFRLVRWTASGQRLPLPDFNGARYFAYSLETLAGPVIGAGRPLSELPDEVIAPFLRVPQSLSPRVAELARTLAAGKASAAAKVQAVVEWLQRTHGYTTDLKRDPRVADPLEDFLFHESAGHCEYFASATVILLRLAGVPARYVNGFLGGEWNSLGGHVTIRDNRAHSWAEAYLGEFGWMRVDATPSALRSGRMGRLRQLLDSVESFWGRWVLNYDVGRQLELAKGLAGSLGARRGQRGSLTFPKPSRGAVLGTLALVAGGLLLARMWRRRRRLARRQELGPAPAESLPVVRLYRKGVRALGRFGLVRTAHETPREFAHRGLAWGLGREEADALTRLTSAYERARYGGIELGPEALHALEAAARTLDAWRGPPPGWMPPGETVATPMASNGAGAAAP